MGGSGLLPCKLTPERHCLVGARGKYFSANLVFLTPDYSVCCLYLGETQSEHAGLFKFCSGVNPYTPPTDSAGRTSQASDIVTICVVPEWKPGRLGLRAGIYFSCRTERPGREMMGTTCSAGST
jgi:hypothetical protein